MVNANISQDKPQTAENSSPLANTKAIKKHQHPLKQNHQTPPQEYLISSVTSLRLPVTTTGKRSKEGHRSKPDACSLKHEENNYQALIPQQQPPDQTEYQSLSKHGLNKKYYNIPPALLPKPQTKYRK